MMIAFSDGVKKHRLSAYITSSSTIAETALPGGLVMAKSRRLELRDNIYGQGLYSTSTTATYLASKEIEIGEKTQNKGCYAV